MITSTQNTQVKQWRKLHQKKYRTKTNSFLIEGFHLLEEAMKSGWELESVIVKEGVEVPRLVQTEEIFFVSDDVYRVITQTESPQGICAVAKMKELPTKRAGFILLMDAIQDPGNVGTMIRTADAAGFSQVVLGKGTVDVYNDKVIRASQGSIFHIPIIQADLQTTIDQLKSEQYTIWVSALKNAVPLYDCQVEEKLALMVGNEGSGVQEKWIQAADQVVNIPIDGMAESLNVSVAAGIFMYHIRSMSKAT